MLNLATIIFLNDKLNVIIIITHISEENIQQSFIVKQNITKYL